MANGLNLSRTKVLQSFDSPTCDREGLRRKACSRDAVVAIACWSEFSGGSAADHLNARERTPQFESDDIKVVFGGAEEDHQRNVWLHDLGVELSHGLTGVSGTGLTSAHTVPLVPVSLDQ